MSAERILDNALASFDAALQAGRLAQAYLVVGNVRQEGIPFAEQALLRLFCEAPAKPCGHCPSCRLVHERKHVDVVWIEPEKKSRVVGIDRIRDLQKLIYETAYSGGWKAVVLAGADRIGEDASNAFLKTLEEPPPRSLYLLLSESPQTIMPTILSRCQRIILSTEAEQLAEPWRTQLVELLAEPWLDTPVHRLGRGGRLDRLLAEIKKAVEKDETGRLTEEAEALHNPDDKKKAKADADLLGARIEARFREQRAMVLRLMLLWYRDLLVTACGGATPSLLHHPERADWFAETARRTGYAGALANIQVIEAMQRQFDRNLPSETVITAAMNAVTA